jgi:Flp pilus assembly protein TadB
MTMWADLLRDGVCTMNTERMANKKSGNLVAAWWNIVICGGLVIGIIVFAITTSPFGFFVALIAAAMEIYFVRVLLGIRAERREDAAAE